MATDMQTDGPNDQTPDEGTLEEQVNAAVQQIEDVLLATRQILDFYCDLPAASSRQPAVQLDTLTALQASYAAASRQLRERVKQCYSTNEQLLAVEQRAAAAAGSSAETSEAELRVRVDVLRRQCEDKNFTVKCVIDTMRAMLDSMTAWQAHARALKREQQSKR